MSGPVLRLPRRGQIQPVDPAAEPTRYYYWPLVGWFYRERLRMMLRALGNTHRPCLLEVAYGSGIFLPSLAPLCDELTGVDLHEHQELVRKNLAATMVTAQLDTGDARALPYPDDAFDAVVSASMLEHLVDPRAVIGEMLRVLRPGGRLVMGFPGQNPAMNAFFRMLGFDPKAIHPSSHRDILDAIEQRHGTVAPVTLPRRLPHDFCLYFVVAVDK